MLVDTSIDASIFTWLTARTVAFYTVHAASTTGRVLRSRIVVRHATEGCRRGRVCCSADLAPASQHGEHTATPPHLLVRSASQRFRPRCQMQQPTPFLHTPAQALDAAAGLLYLHRRNIIHRDLKSPNLVRDSSRPN